MCSDVVSVRIDTGAVMKALRRPRHGAVARGTAAAAARHMSLILAAARTGLSAGSALQSTNAGAALVEALGRIRRGTRLPKAAPPLPRAPALRGRPRVVYFPTCLTRSVGALEGEPRRSLADSVGCVLDWAGYDFVYPMGSPACAAVCRSDTGLPAAAEQARSQATAPCEKRAATERTPS